MEGDVHQYHGLMMWRRLLHMECMVLQIWHMTEADGVLLWKPQQRKIVRQLTRERYGLTWFLKQRHNYNCGTKIWKKGGGALLGRWNKKEIKKGNWVQSSGIKKISKTGHTSWSTDMFEKGGLSWGTLIWECDPPPTRVSYYDTCCRWNSVVKINLTLF